MLVFFTIRRSVWYSWQVLRRDLTHALRKKRPGVPLEEFILHMDNASSHTAEITTLELAVLGFSTIQHPPYSPDLAPFDFSIFPTIKAQLKGTRFDSLQELRTATSRITQQYDASWYHDIFRQWIDRHRKCIQHRGEYFEKEWRSLQKVKTVRRQRRHVLQICVRRLADTLLFITVIFFLFVVIFQWNFQDM